MSVDKVTVDCGTNPANSFLKNDFSPSESFVILFVKVNFPLVGVKIPEIILSNVLFPLPDFPTIQINSLDLQLN